MKPKKNDRHRQQGATLVVSLIMLVVLTLLVVSAILIGNTNLKSVGNLQSRNEATAAAQQAIEQILGDVNNFYTLTNHTIAIGGVPGFTVTVFAPVCLKLAPEEGYSVEFAESAPKITYWDIKADVTDNKTGAHVVIHQGAKVKMDSTATC
jgi:Tfp pilus assembly protein PilX